MSKSYKRAKSRNRFSKIFLPGAAGPGLATSSRAARNKGFSVGATWVKSPGVTGIEARAGKLLVGAGFDTKNKALGGHFTYGRKSKSFSVPLKRR